MRKRISMPDRDFMKAANLIFPHQLFEDNPLFKLDGTFFLIEEYLYFNQYNFHVQKLVFHRSSMKYYEDFLKKKNKEVIYVNQHEIYSDIRKFIPYLKTNGFNHINYILTEDNYLDKRILSLSKEYSISINFLDSPMFLNKRSDLDFLCSAISVAIQSGATTINIPDTVGYTVPSEFSKIIKYIKNGTEEIDKIILSVHCHNDLGLAVANSLTAIHEGVRQIECTINGLGERAGNASLEEIVMALKVRNDLNPYKTGINTKNIYPCSKLVSTVTGVNVQPNKAIVGANAFAHEAGIHQDGVLKQRNTYEIMEASEVGIPSNHIVLGKHSGRHAFKDRLNDFGYKLSEDKFEIAFVKFIELCDKKKYVFDEDIEALINEEFVRSGDFYKLNSLACSSGTDEKPKAKLSLNIDGQIIVVEESGDGPIDSVFQSICKAAGITPKLDSYNVASVTGGMDAQAEVSVIIKEDNHTARGKGSSTDVIVASAKAFINALNNLRWRKLHPKIVSPKGI